MGVNALRADEDALRTTLEFLRRHNLTACEKALAREIAREDGGASGGMDYGDDEETTSEEASDSEDEEESKWSASTLRRLRSVDVSGRAMVTIAEEMEEKRAKEERRASTVSNVEPFDELDGTRTHEEALAMWRARGDANCEYEDDDDEGFERCFVPRHEVWKYVVDSFVATEVKLEGEPDDDGHVHFKLAEGDGKTPTEGDAKTPTLDRPGSFTFGDGPSESEIADGNTTPLPSGWTDPTHSAYDAFHLKVYHKASKTGFETSKEFVVKYGDVVANRYRIAEGIGRAAFSKTVRAQDLQTNKAVCLKIIKNNKDCVDQGLDEIKLLKMLNDKDPKDEQGILRMLDFFYFKEHLFIVSELLRANLHEFQKYDLETTPTPYFSLARIQRVAKQVLKSLAFVHDFNLIHCDLKPENILMKSYADCTVKIIDFGSSCFTTDVIGTYAQSRAYRAPEVIIGTQYSQKVDVWSLGCILAEIYSGRVLFRNNSVSGLLARMVSIRGPFDPKMLAQGTQSQKYFTKQGFLYELDEMSGSLTILRPKRTSLRRRIGSDDEDLVDFLERLLCLDPERRASAAEALAHPWLSKVYEQ